MTDDKYLKSIREGLIGSVEGDSMTDDEYLESIREGLSESVEYFYSKNKFIREQWVVREFILNLSIPFDKSELLRGGDPPDVIFRDAKFEVKEILDKDRRRHEEYKNSLKNAIEATDPANLLKSYSPKDITVLEVFNLVYERASELATRKYSLEDRLNMDLLFYVNLQGVMGLIESPYPDVLPLAELGYRSVAFLDGHYSCVLCTQSTAPTLLRAHHGISCRVIR